MFILLGGPYGLFAGRDASRALATFSMSEDAFRNEYDDLTDLSSMQMESVREWEMQFTGKNNFKEEALWSGLELLGIFYSIPAFYTLHESQNKET